MPFNNHLKSYEDLITPHEATRAGFISLALEKNSKATPFINEAKALKVFASRQDADKYLDKLVKRGYVIKVKDSD